MHVDGIAQVDSVLKEDAIHEQREAGPEAALIVQDVATDSTMFSKIRFQDLSDRIARCFHSGAADMALNER
jgi:hypothetical protein